MCVIKSDRCIINRQGSREYVIQGHRCQLVGGAAERGKNAAYRVETGAGGPYLLLVLVENGWSKMGCTCGSAGALGYCQHCRTVERYLRS